MSNGPKQNQIEPENDATDVIHAWDNEAAKSVASWKTLVRFAADVSCFTSPRTLGPIQGRGRRMVAQTKNLIWCPAGWPGGNAIQLNIIRLIRHLARASWPKVIHLMCCSTFVN